MAEGDRDRDRGLNSIGSTTATTTAMVSTTTTATATVNTGRSLETRSRSADKTSTLEKTATLPLQSMSFAGQYGEEALHTVTEGSTDRMEESADAFSASVAALVEGGSPMNLSLKFVHRKRRDEGSDIDKEADKPAATVTDIATVLDPARADSSLDAADRPGFSKLGFATPQNGDDTAAVPPGVETG